MQITESVPKHPTSLHEKHTSKISLQHDGSIDIAPCRSRVQKKWKTQQWQLSEFYNKVAITKITDEPHAEYLSLDKKSQDQLKDVGGYVTGCLCNGHRNAGSILYKQVATLDGDFITSDIWDDYLLEYGTAGCMHSTRKHTREKPRIRLIVPLDRKVTTEEYRAITRKIAGTLGIDQFDHTTFQPERLMYWPSTSKDAEFVFDYCDAPWLSADEILNSYNNWQDISEWPRCAREDEIIMTDKKKQQDPRKKEGVIGAFCRAYDIHEAIEKFLPDVYEATDAGDRYTYKQGSTTAGLIVYDDGTFAHSHHSTDPACGKTCNAFDLVRIHKFGLMDENYKEVNND